MEKTKERNLIKAYIGVFFGLVTFALSVAGLITQRNGNEVTLEYIGLLLATIALTLLFLLQGYPALITYEIEKKLQEYQHKGLSTYPMVPIESFVQQLTDRKFKKIKGDYYYRKVFSIAVDSIAYYIKIVDASSNDAIIEEESKLFKFTNPTIKGKNTCLILFLRVPAVENKDIEYALDVSINYQINCEFLRIKKVIVPILIDQNHQYINLADFNTRFSLNIFDYGVRFIKKVLSDAS